jgi:hypothetical protein
MLPTVARVDPTDGGRLGRLGSGDVLQPKITPSSPNASGTASATMSICRHRREHREPRQVLVGVDLVREPGVGAPTPTTGRRAQASRAEPLPRGVVRHQGRDLREREDEHEVEEELERG